MAVSVMFPVTHVEDANGLPYVGARQLVYEAGTTTLRPVFTDAALTTPAPNPQISNAKGDFPRVFTAPGTYKVRLEQAIVYPATSGLFIAECDDIDSGLSAGTVALGIDRGGTGATTAAAARANLGVPSTSELTALANQVTALSASLQNIAAFPQGRLTLASGSPILSSSVSAASTVYYTPYVGQLCPVWDGVQFNLKVFSEMSLTLNVSHVLNSIYDVYFINDATDGIKLVTGAAWSNIGLGTGSRAGTADITRLQGLVVNSAQQTMRNGATTYIVPANRGTYLGSIYMDGTAGQVSCLMSYGQLRKWGVWNAYSRVPVTLKAGDPTSSWSYNSATVRGSNATQNNSLTVFCGLPEEFVSVDFKQRNLSISSAGAAITIAAQNYIGLNGNVGANAIGSFGFMQEGNLQSSAGNMNSGLGAILLSSYDAPPAIGINSYYCMEAGNGTAGQTFYGTESNMILRAQWRA